MPNAMIGFSPESNWVTSKLPLVGGGNVSVGAGRRCGPFFAFLVVMSPNNFDDL